MSRLVGLGLAFEQPTGSAFGQAAEQLEDLHPGDRDQRLGEGIRLAGLPALAIRSEDAVLGDADQGADAGLLGALKGSQRPRKVGFGQTSPGQLGLPLGAIEPVDPIAPRLALAAHQ